MNASHINDTVMQLAGAVSKDDDQAIPVLAIQLLSQFLIDMNRIAAALETLAKRGLP